MNQNKRLFKSILISAILRKHRHKMIDLEHFHRKRTVGTQNKPIEEYGMKWLGGTIFLRHYINANRVEFLAQIGGHFDSIEINYYESDSDDFITMNKDLIKEMIQEVEVAFYLTNN